MSLRSIYASAAVRYLSEVWPKKVKPVGTTTDTSQADLREKQDKHLDFLGLSVGQPSREWRNDRR